MIEAKEKKTKKILLLKIIYFQKEAKRKEKKRNFTISICC